MSKRRRYDEYDDLGEENGENVITIGNLMVVSHNSDLQKVVKTVKELVKSKEVREFLKKQPHIPQAYMG